MPIKMTPRFGKYCRMPPDFRELPLYLSKQGNKLHGMGEKLGRCPYRAGEPAAVLLTLSLL